MRRLLRGGKNDFLTPKTVVTMNLLLLILLVLFVIYIVFSTTWSSSSNTNYSYDAPKPFECPNLLEHEKTITISNEVKTYKESKTIRFYVPLFSGDSFEMKYLLDEFSNDITLQPLSIYSQGRDKVMLYSRDILFLIGLRSIQKSNFITLEAYQKNIKFNIGDKLYFLFEDGTKETFENEIKGYRKEKDSDGVLYETRIKCGLEFIDKMKRVKLKKWKYVDVKNDKVLESYFDEIEKYRMFILAKMQLMCIDKYIGKIDIDYKKEFEKVLENAEVKQDFSKVDISFVAIDFETANRRRGSACAIGMCKVENGTITDRYVKVLRPEPFEFERRNIAIHGIDEDKARQAPTIAEDWESIKSFVGDLPLVAHNASFDKSVLDRSLEANGIDASSWSIDCTMLLSKILFSDRSNYKLDDLSKEFGIELSHHDAGSDAEACAKLMLVLTSIKSKITGRGRTKNDLKHDLQ